MLGGGSGGGERRRLQRWAVGKAFGSLVSVCPVVFRLSEIIPLSSFVFLLLFLPFLFLFSVYFIDCLGNDWLVFAIFFEWSWVFECAADGFVIDYKKWILCCFLCGDSNAFLIMGKGSCLFILTKTFRARRT